MWDISYQSKLRLLINYYLFFPSNTGSVKFHLYNNQIATCFALSQSAKPFVIRSFFFEKWLLTHGFGESRVQKASCKQACIGSLNP